MSSRAPKASYDLVLLPGDGIGVEVIAEARAMLDQIGAATGVAFAIDEITCGGKYYLEHGAQRDWPAGSEEKRAAADAILLGAVGWPTANGSPATMKNGQMAGWSPVIGNRIKLDLYANVRPVRLLPGVQHNLSGHARAGVEARARRHDHRARGHRGPVLRHRRARSRRLSARPICA